MSGIKISIGVPVFNSEKYLRRCLDSIINQTFEDIEIILINDCSKDDSETIIQEYLSRDNRIKYYKHHNNMGPGGARNTIVRKSKGRYIGFIDSDDYIAPSMYEILLNRAITTGSDMVVCGYNHVEDDGAIITNRPFEDKTLKEGGFFLDWLKNNGFINVMPWNKLYKRELFIKNKIKFPEHIYHQDYATIPRLLHYCRSVSFITDILYNWVIRSDSVTLTASEKRIHDNFIAFNILKNFMKSNHLLKEHKKYFYKTCYRSIRFNINNAYKTLGHDPEALSAYSALYLSKMLEEVPVEEIVSLIDLKLLQNLINIEDIINTLENHADNKWLRFSQLNKKRKIIFLLRDLLGM